MITTIHVLGVFLTNKASSSSSWFWAIVSSLSPSSRFLHLRSSFPSTVIRAACNWNTDPSPSLVTKWWGVRKKRSPSAHFSFRSHDYEPKWWVMIINIVDNHSVSRGPFLLTPKGDGISISGSVAGIMVDDDFVYFELSLSWSWWWSYLHVCF